ncbi:unnamed protein product [Hymenolepis diminuta]|uniref:Uncharacterized protein n=1 Tax=Hymenolepis diminuta TaxID=6216 RepID=A0A0R3STU9_HYMDI|nr:unnamed protein product [Hymenolepis diminuta]
MIGGYVRPDPTEVPTVHAKFPPTVMLFGVVSSERHIMIQFFPQDLRVSADVYVETLQIIVKTQCLPTRFGSIP